MKQKLLKTMALALLAMCSVGTWALDVTPTLDVLFRTNGNNDGWNDSNYPKTASETNNVWEVVAKNRMFALQKYTVDNLSHVKKITLTVKNNSGGDAMCIWAFSKNDWTASSSVSDIVTAYTNAVGVAPGATSGTVNTSYLKDDKNTNKDGVCTFIIEGTALTTLKNTASGNTFTLLITNKTSELLGSTTGRKFYSSGDATEANRPFVTVEYKVYNATNTTDYDTLSDAMASATTNTESDTELQLFDDVALSGRITYGNQNGKTVTIKPMRDITITGPTNSMWFLINRKGTGSIESGTAGTLSIGSADNSITFDGKDGIYANHITKREAGSICLTNITFKDFDLNNAANFCNVANIGGTYTLDKITFDNCKNPSTAFVYSERIQNGAIVLKGYLNQTNCTGTTIMTKYSSTSDRGRIQVSDDSFSASAPITINYNNFTKTVGDGPLVVGISKVANAAEIFDLVNEDWGLYKNNNDLDITQAYTLEVSDAKAATLVLPFATAVLPTNTSAYDLTYTGGNDITASSVSAITANKPVLVTATAAGKYKFISSATSGDPATGSGTQVNGALTGVYEDTTVPTNSFILTKHDDVVAFRKANGTTNKVKANRAYLTASYSATAPEFLFINFDGGNETTAIDAVEKLTLTDDGAVYNLQGVRMTGSNLKKGIYVKNGKKFIVK